MNPPIDLLTAQQLLITSRSGPLVWPADTDGTEYDLLFACACTDLRLFYAAPISAPASDDDSTPPQIKYAYANCAEHDWRACGILLKPASGPRWERTERRRRSGCTTEHYHRVRGGAA